MTFNDWPWRHWREVRGDAQAIRLGDETLSWRELCARIDTLAAGFREQNVQPDQAVMLRASNHPDTLLVWRALWQWGARVLHVTPQLP
ncbi:MAG TPA: o-succinylbenzoate--CoA ligase, partial [Leclercia adecarboxylata]|nr:o-succinylbenzoate--CoA ligase [Leclercia adecarboxylata]